MCLPKYSPIISLPWNFLVFHLNIIVTRRIVTISFTYSALLSSKVNYFGWVSIAHSEITWTACDIWYNDYWSFRNAWQFNISTTLSEITVNKSHVYGRTKQSLPLNISQYCRTQKTHYVLSNYFSAKTMWRDDMKSQTEWVMSRSTLT